MSNMSYAFEYIISMFNKSVDNIRVALESIFYWLGRFPSSNAISKHGIFHIVIYSDINRMVTLRSG